MSDDLQHIDDVAMLKDDSFHPITKSSMKGAGKLDCSVDTRYETGIIFCNDRGRKSNVSATIAAAAIIFTACIFIFSLKFEIKDIGSLPVVAAVFFNPYVLAAVFVIVIAVAAARKR